MRRFCNVWRGRPFLAMALLGGHLCWGAACTEVPTTFSANFAVPSGLAVVHSSEELLFVANSDQDSFQVIRLNSDLSALTLVPSVPLYFGLHIPTGPVPTKAAETRDGAFVVSLDAGTEELSLVHADPAVSLRPVYLGEDAEGPRVVATLGERGSDPVDLVASPVGCGEGCSGRFFVALAGLRALAVVEVSRAGTFGPVRFIPLPGSPASLAVHPLGGLVFAADATASKVYRVDIFSGAVLTLATEASVGPLAVSTDGALLLAGRPSRRDVLIFADITSSMPVPFAANAPYARLPDCMALCGDDAACVDAHPADRALCQTPTGFAATESYPAVFVGGVPVQLVTLGVGAGQPPMILTCDSDKQTHHDEYALVATLDGDLRALILHDERGRVRPQLASTGWCIDDAIDVVVDPDDGDNLQPPALDAFLQPCLEVPADQPRLACIADPGGDAGVVVFRGQGADGTWGFAWEGSLPGLVRRSGGGEMVADNLLGDVDLDFGAFDIQPGDILEVEEKSYSCSRACREWHIEELVRDDEGVTTLRLAGDGAQASCFSGAGNIGYRVRLGGAFVVGKTSADGVRLRPGERFGVGGDVGTDRAIAFVARAFSDEEMGLDADLCARYVEDNADDWIPAVPGMLPFLSRNQPIGMVVTERYFAPNLSVAIDGSGPAGRLPGDMVVWDPDDGADPIVFVSFTGSDSVLAFSATNPGDGMTTSGYQVLH